MKRFLILTALLLAAAPGANAELGRSTCAGGFHADDPGTCTLIPYAPIARVSGTSPAGPDGTASVHVILTNSITGMVLAECASTSTDGPATCRADVNTEYAGLTSVGATNSGGSGLPGICTGSGSGDGTFSCYASTI